MCVYILFQILFPVKLLKNVEYSSLCYTAGLFVGYLFLYSSVCILKSCTVKKKKARNLLGMDTN